jgi:hypothetical protein
MIYCSYEKAKAGAAAQEAFKKIPELLNARKLAFPQATVELWTR